jgi:hypothetical protein
MAYAFPWPGLLTAYAIQERRVPFRNRLVLAIGLLAYAQKILVFRIDEQRHMPRTTDT